MCRRSQAGWISPEEIARMQAKRGDEVPPMTEDVRILSNSYNKIGRFDLSLDAPGRNGEPRVIFVIPLDFASLLILLLPERKFLNIIPAVAEYRQRRSLVWVDVLYIAVETRATTTGFGASRRFLHTAARNSGAFLVGGSRLTQGKSNSSTCFEGVNHARASRRMWNFKISRGERSSL